MTKTLAVRYGPVLALMIGAVSLSGQSATIRIAGGSHTLALTAADLAAMPRTSVTASAHHATGTWEGVA